MGSLLILCKYHTDLLCKILWRRCCRPWWISVIYESVKRDTTTKRASTHHVLTALRFRVAFKCRWELETAIERHAVTKETLAVCLNLPPRYYKNTAV